MKKVVVITFILLSFFFISFPTFAAKKTTKNSSNVSVSTSFLKQKNSVRASFSNLKNAKKVSYILSYDANGVGQGVMGSFVPGKSNVISRDLYLGTCSKNVCVKHKNVKNIQLEVTTTYKKGPNTTNTYKVR